MNIPDDVAARAAHVLGLLVARRRLARQPVDTSLIALRDLLEHHATPGTDIIDTTDAARILRCGPREVRRKAERLGGVRVAGVWCFQRTTIEEFARNPPERTYRKRPSAD